MLECTYGLQVSNDRNNFSLKLNVDTLKYQSIIVLIIICPQTASMDMTG